MKRRVPWINPRLARKKARLHRLIRKGLAPAGDKATLQALADDANAGRIPRSR